MNRVYAAAAVAAFFFAPAAARAAGPDDLLAKAAAFTGSPAGLRTVYRFVPPPAAAATPVPATADSAPDRAPLDPATLTTVRTGLLYRTDIARGGVVSPSGFTGSFYWLASVNGVPVRLYEDTARIALTTNTVEARAFSGVPAESRPPVTIEGKTFDVVRVTPPGGFTADLAIDTATGELRRMTMAPDNIYEREVTTYDAAKEVAAGVHVATGYTQGRAHFALVSAAAAPVAPAELALPVTTATWTFGEPAAVPIDVAQRRAGGRSVHVHAVINGKPGTFLLDSGAAVTLLYKDFADGLGAETLGPTSYSGVNGGVVSATHARVKTIAIGNATLNNVIVSVSKAQFQPDIDGILGFDIFASALVDVDLAAGTIAVMDPVKYAPAMPAGAVAFPVDLSTLQPSVRIDALGVPFHIVVDTGNDFLIVLSDDARTSGRLVSLPASINIGGREAAYSIFYGGVDGTAPKRAPCIRLNRVQVGPYRYENALSCFGNPYVFGKDGGLLGFDFLRHFNWTFDYPEAKLILTPNGR